MLKSTKHQNVLRGNDISTAAHRNTLFALSELTARLDKLNRLARTAPRQNLRDALNHHRADRIKSYWKGKHDGLRHAVSALKKLLREHS